MKKLLLITTILTATTVFGKSGQLAESVNKPYITFGTGTTSMSKITQSCNEQDIKLPSLRSAAKISPVFKIGAGKYINDKVRIELAYEYTKPHFKVATISHSDNITEYDEDYDFYRKIKYNLKLNLHRRASIHTAMLNSYVDLPLNERSEFFLGGGCGLAKIKEKVDISTRIAAHSQTVHYEDESYTSENKANFAYKLTAGVAFKIDHKTNFDITYSWTNYGKTSYSHPDAPDGKAYKGHSAMASLRFDI